MKTTRKSPFLIPFSQAPKWVNRYPDTFMANRTENTIATYDPVTDEVELSVYGSLQQFERERKYCLLWIANGGHGIMRDIV